MKKPTSNDVAKLAGVSQSTVSLVLNNKTNVSIPEKTREKVLEAAKSLNYIPNMFAKGLKTNKSKLIGLMVPTITNPYYPMLTQSIEEYAASKGYNVLLCNTYRQTKLEDFYLNLMIEKSVDGIIYEFTPHSYNNIIKKLDQIPVVIIGEKDDKAQINTVGLNSFMSGEIIAQHLIDLGHENIAFVTTPLDGISLSRQKRLQGIKSKLKEYGLDKNLVVKAHEHEYENNDSTYEIEVGYNMTSEILKDDKITAIIGVNDMVAFGALSAVLNNGYKVPKDISICGFDNIYLSRILAPKITTVDHFVLHRSKLAIDILIDLFNNSTEDNNVFKMEYDPQLIVRQSTGPAKKS